MNVILFATLFSVFLSFCRAQGIDDACGCTTLPTNASIVTRTITQSSTQTSYYSTITNIVYQAVVLSANQPYTLTESSAHLSTSIITVTKHDDDSPSSSLMTLIPPDYSATSTVIITITPPNSSTTGTTTLTSFDTISTDVITLDETSTLITSRPHPPVRSSFAIYSNTTTQDVLSTQTAVLTTYSTYTSTINTTMTPTSYMLTSAAPTSSVIAISTSTTSGPPDYVLSLRRRGLPAPAVFPETTCQARTRVVVVTTTITVLPGSSSSYSVYSQDASTPAYTAYSSSEGTTTSTSSSHTSMSTSASTSALVSSTTTRYANSTTSSLDSYSITASANTTKCACNNILARDVSTVTTVYVTTIAVQQESAVSTVTIWETYTEPSLGASYAISYVTVGDNTTVMPPSVLLTTTSTTLSAVPAATVSRFL